MTQHLTPEGYDNVLNEIKERVRHAQLRAALAVNRELIELYWQIGRMISERMQTEGWGAKVVDQLAADLRKEFPDMKGFSPRNLRYMRAFAEAYPDQTILQAAPARITWYHNTTLLDKVKDPTVRGWYAKQTIEHGWSRNVLVHQIESGLYQRQGQAVNNFDRTLPPPQSDLARQALKDPYIFDFLALAAEAQERDLERSLLEHVRDFLLELGIGFAFVGSQYHLEVGGQDFYLDLLFYHLRLRCYVILDLKMGDFAPEYAGKMNFYLAAADDLLRHGDDQPSIGIILCKSRNRVVAEYSLRNMQSPLGVTTYRVTQALPEAFEGNLPRIEELEATLREATEAAASDDTDSE